MYEGVAGVSGCEVGEEKGVTLGKRVYVWVSGYVRSAAGVRLTDHE